MLCQFNSSNAKERKIQENQEEAKRTEQNNDDELRVYFVKLCLSDCRLVYIRISVSMKNDKDSSILNKKKN